MRSATRNGSSRAGHTPASFQFGQVGQVACLSSLPLFTNSVINDQLQHVNADVCGHPLMIIGTTHYGKLSTVCQMTSFGTRTIQQKYPVPNLPILDQYIAIEHGKTERHSRQPILQLANDDTFRKQSYVNLDQFFTIETSFLQPWGKGRVKTLDPCSIATLEKAFIDFITGITPRRKPTLSSIQSPLDYRKAHCTPCLLGVNDYRFVKPKQGSHALAIVTPPTPPPTPPRKSPLQASLSTRANGAQSFQTSRMGSFGK